MGVSGHLHIPFSLHLREEVPEYVQWEGAWTPEPVRTFWQGENPLPLLGIWLWYLRGTACYTLYAENSNCRLQSSGCDTIRCFCLQHKNVPWRWRQQVFPTLNQTIQHQIWEGCSHTVQCCESLKYPNRLCGCCILLYVFPVLHPS
jgi:hypothetical protein